MDSVIFTRIKELCAENNITINKLESELGMSQYSIGRWKSSTSPTIDKISKIAEYFNVSIDYLLENTDIPTPPSLDEQLDGIEFALFGEIKDLTDEQKQEILDYVRFKQQQNEQKNSH